MKDVESISFTDIFQISSNKIEKIWNIILNWLNKINAEIKDYNEFLSIEAEHGTLAKVNYKEAFKIVKIEIIKGKDENSTINLKVSLEYTALSTNGPPVGKMFVGWFIKELLHDLNRVEN